MVSLGGVMVIVGDTSVTVTCAESAMSEFAVTLIHAVPPPSPVTVADVPLPATDAIPLLLDVQLGEPDTVYPKSSVMDTDAEVVPSVSMAELPNDIAT